MEWVALVKPCNDAAVDHVGKWSLGATHWKAVWKEKTGPGPHLFFYKQIPTCNLETRHVELMIVRNTKCKLMKKLIS
jgi:hypothetical protein